MLPGDINIGRSVEEDTCNVRLEYRSPKGLYSLKQKRSCNKCSFDGRIT